VSGSSGADGTGVLAHLPGVDRAAVEEAVRAPVTWCDEVSDLLARLGRRRWAVTLLTLDHGTADPALAARIGEEPSAGVLFLFSTEATVERVLAAEEAGAASLLGLPPEPEALRREVAPIPAEPGSIPVEAPEGAPEPEGDEAPLIVGRSPALVEVFRVVGRVAPSSATVLITGESGTGKELVARALHRRGERADGPFVPVNCAAIPDALLEAELFGHERGAFTGAVGRSEGRFGRADGGTLFLDEVGEMSVALQAKLLRVLESGEVERLGGGEVQRVDARVVAATNRDLRERVREGRFREDLLFRLAVVEVELPPLRARPGDVRPLALHFARRLSRAHGRPIHHLSRRALERLEAHDWPGNVRELRNVIDRAVLLARGGVVRSTDLRTGPDAPRTSPVGDPGGSAGYPPTLSLDEVEARHVRHVLRHTGGHMGRAAEILGIHRNTMTAKVRQHEIDVDALGEP